MSFRRIGLAALVLIVAIGVAAIVPGDAWSPGSAEITAAPILNRPRVLSVDTGLALAPRDHAVLVSTGDGGGAGLVEGLDAPLRVRATTFRDRSAWEIGTRQGAPATYVDDNGVRLDDGMIDRLRQRAAWLALAAGVLMAVLVALRRR